LLVNSINTFQHLPRGANETLRDGKLAPFRKHLAPFGRSRLYHVGIYWVYLYPLLKGFNGKGLRLNSGPGPSIPRLTTIFPFQGCRFGPESSRQFRSNCFISSGGGFVSENVWDKSATLLSFTEKNTQTN